MKSDVNNFTTTVTDHAQVHTLVQGNVVHIHEEKFADKLKSKLEQVFADLPMVFEGFSEREAFVFKRLLAKVETMRNDPATLKWIEDQFKQMTNTYSDDEAEKILDKLQKLIQFFLLLQANECMYTLDREGQWTKITGKKASEQRKFELFDSSKLMDLSIKVIGPMVLKFLLDKDFPLGAEDVVLICRKPNGCKEECLEKAGLFPAAIQDFTNVELYREEKPSFFDNGLKGQIRVTCGSCLVDITEHLKGKEILERMFSS